MEVELFAILGDPSSHALTSEYSGKHEHRGLLRALIDQATFWGRLNCMCTFSQLCQPESFLAHVENQHLTDILCNNKEPLDQWWQVLVPCSVQAVWPSWVYGRWKLSVYIASSYVCGFKCNTWGFLFPCNVCVSTSVAACLLLGASKPQMSVSSLHTFHILCSIKQVIIHHKHINWGCFFQKVTKKLSPFSELLCF